MSRLSSRVLAAVGAGAIAVALTVSGGVPADAAPASGPITQARDLLGVWVGELSGYNEAQEVDLQYRLTVRKAKGQAGVAWQEWRDCADHEAACAAGKTTGGGWTQPSRVLFAMDKGHVVHGVGEAGQVIMTPDTTGNVLSVVKVSLRPPDGLTRTTTVFGKAGHAMSGRGDGDVLALDDPMPTPFTYHPTPPPGHQMSGMGDGSVLALAGDINRTTWAALASQTGPNVTASD